MGGSTCSRWSKTHTPLWLENYPIHANLTAILYRHDQAGTVKAATNGFLFNTTTGM
jgi:hypothetical protein